MDKVTTDIATIVASKFGFEKAVLLAFIEVETGGKGFNNDGKIMIQFEPAWMKRIAPYTPSGKWSVNKVDVQSKEWEAFNEAFRLNPDAAMKSTSIGLGQIMGFHYKILGFASVGALWDDAKAGLENQITQIAKFISSDRKLAKAIVMKDWFTIASIYNGAGFMALAKRLGREPYNISMKKAYERYLKLG